MLGADNVFACDSDMIPVDYAVNLIIAVAWCTALDRYQVFCAISMINQELKQLNYICI